MTVTADNFTSIPVLGYALLSSPATRPVFIAQLQHALINVGFLYLERTPIPDALFDDVIAYLPRVFGLPQERKDALRMANSPHFLGYSRLGAEMTKGAVDQREQFDIATPLESAWKPGKPDYVRLWGPSQWPEEDDVPGFKATFTRYLGAVESLSYEFAGLVAEALGLPPDGLARFYDAPERMQHRSKVRCARHLRCVEDAPARNVPHAHSCYHTQSVSAWLIQYRFVSFSDQIVKYPTRDQVASGQGVGPHFDGGFLTFLLQASDHPGLQVQNLSGEWIDVPPRPYTFVINIGKALEMVTQGLARATSHRVLAPAAGTSPRYSIPFFQNIAQGLRLSEHVLQLPPEVLKLKGHRGELGQTDSLNMAEYDSLPSGQVSLINRVKSHPDVAERHYPQLFKLFFPDGLPAYGTAY